MPELERLCGCGDREASEPESKSCSFCADLRKYSALAKLASLKPVDSLRRQRRPAANNIKKE